MKHHAIVLKLATLVSSTLLVVGFISYRAGVFDRFLQSGHPATKAEQLLPRTSTTEQVRARKPEDAVYMSSSKTIIFHETVNPSSANPTQSTAQPKPSAEK